MSDEKLTRAVYSRPDVRKSIEDARHKHDASKLDDDGEEIHYSVFVKDNRVFTVRQGSAAPGIPVFDTEEGEYIE